MQGICDLGISDLNQQNGPQPTDDVGRASGCPCLSHPVTFLVTSSSRSPRVDSQRRGPPAPGAAPQPTAAGGQGSGRPPGAVTASGTRPGHEALRSVLPGTVFGGGGKRNRLDPQQRGQVGGARCSAGHWGPFPASPPPVSVAGLSPPFMKCSPRACSVPGWGLGPTLPEALGVPRQTAAPAWGRGGAGRASRRRGCCSVTSRAGEGAGVGRGADRLSGSPESHERETGHEPGARQEPHRLGDRAGDLGRRYWGYANRSRAGRARRWPGCGLPPCLPHQQVSGVQGTEMGACPPAINHRARLYNYLGT